MNLSEALNSFEKQIEAPKKKNELKLSLEQQQLKESLQKWVSQVTTYNCKTSADLTFKYQKALQEGLEKVYPDKRWFEVTNCDIKATLVESNNNINSTIDRILTESVIDDEAGAETEELLYLPEVGQILILHIPEEYGYGPDERDYHCKLRYLGLEDGYMKFKPLNKDAVDIAKFEEDGFEYDGFFWQDPEGFWDDEGSFEFVESLQEDTVKQGGVWVNKGEEGTHGKFKTKKEADSQRKAMFAQGYKAEDLEEANRKTTVKDKLAKLKSSGVLDEAHTDLSEKDKTISHALKRTMNDWAAAETKEEAVSILTRALKDEGLDTPASKKFLMHVSRQPLNKIIETATNYMMSGMDFSMRKGTPGYDKNFKGRKNECKEERQKYMRKPLQESDGLSDDDVMNNLNSGMSLGKALGLK